MTYSIETGIPVPATKPRSRKPRSIWVSGTGPYLVLEEVPGQRMVVETESGPTRVYPSYIGWTWVGFSFKEKPLEELL